MNGRHFVLVALVSVFFMTSASYAGTVSTFIGGDPGEGLDLQGQFIYAVNVGQGGNSGTGPVLPVGDAHFQDDFSGVQRIPGITAYHAAYDPWQTKPEYGATTNDDHLETIVHSMGLKFNNRQYHEMELVPGQKYKLQAIYNENHFGAGPGGTGQAREMDVWFYDGVFATDPAGAGRTIWVNENNFNIVDVVGAPNTLTTGAVITQEFTAESRAATLANMPPASPSPGADTNSLINAFTVEAIPDPAVISVIHGGDDLQLGSGVVYAVNVSTESDVYTVGGIDFLPHGDVSGVTVNSNAGINNWGSKPELGSTADDDALEGILHDIRYSNNATVSIDADVEAGMKYRLQLLFSENWHDGSGTHRFFDVLVDDVELAEALDLNDVTGGWSDTPTEAVMLTYEFTAPDDLLNIVLNPAGIAGQDNNPIINGFTLAEIPEPHSAALLCLGLLGLTVGRRRRRPW